MKVGFANIFFPTFLWNLIHLDRVAYLDFEFETQAESEAPTWGDEAHLNMMGGNCQLAQISFS